MVRRISKKKFKLGVLIFVAIGLSVALHTYVLSLIGLRPALPQDIAILMGFAITLFPPSIMHLINVWWRRDVDRNIVKLLRQVAESARVGVSIPEALAIASNYDFGALTPELKKAVVRISWGYDFKETIERLMEDLGTRTARRVFRLIIEAAEVGGNVEEMLMILQKHISGIQLTLRERAAMMKPYISYGYLALFTFLAIQIVLMKSFFIPILEAQAKAAAIEGTFKVTITKEELQTYMYHISILEAIFAGLVSGKLGEGTVFAGLKHVAILLAAVVISYYSFIF